MMKKLMLIAVLALVSGGCKTTEANYRAAYVTAKEKNASGLGADVDDKMAGEEMARPKQFGNVTLPVLTTRLYVAAVDGVGGVSPKVFNVAVARFKQTFNAKSLCNRLREAGFPDSFVAMDREKNYYVLTGTTADAQEASARLEQSASSDVYSAKSPFPCVIVSR